MDKQNSDRVPTEQAEEMTSRAALPQHSSVKYWALTISPQRCLLIAVLCVFLTIALLMPHFFKLMSFLSIIPTG